MRKLLALMTLFAACCSAAYASAPFATLTIKKKNINLDIPDSLLGRRILLSTSVVSSTSPYPPVGRKISPDMVFTVNMVDSSIVFTLCDDSFFVVDAEQNIEKALDVSRAQAVSYVFPIKKKGKDGYRITANKLFNLGTTNVASLKGMSYGPYSVSSAEFKEDMSAVQSVESFGSSIALRTDATYKFKLKTQMIVMELDEDFFCTMDVATSLTLLPESPMAHKKADPRIGTFNVAMGEFSANRGVRKEEWICRWDLDGDNCITMYVDTLFAESERKAIREGFEAWNDAFVKAGKGRKIEVFDYPRDSAFRSYNPLVSTVSKSGQSSNISAKFLSNGSDRILAANIYVPANYVLSVRRNSVYAISDVDTRYQKYHLSDDAINEVLRADIIRVAGQCLGIAPNYAGSMAYSPEQLRSPEFTQKYGITASATDDVLFNYLTRPGDKERGVVTIVDRAGVYDVYALDWIYGDGKYSRKPEFFYAPMDNIKPDARVRYYDLSYDSEEAFRSGMAHLQYVADKGAKVYLAEEGIDESYKQLFLDWIWLRSSKLVYLLTSNVGAYEYNIPFEGNVLPKYKALPAELQRRSLAAAFDFWRNFEWLDHSDLLHVAGLNANTSDMSRSNAFKMVNATYRFKFVAYAARYADSEYSLEQYMNDMETQVFKYMKKGKMPNGETFIVGQYIHWLASNAGLGSKVDVPGAAEICARYLHRAKGQLKACRSAMREENLRMEIDYLLRRLEKLENNK